MRVSSGAVALALCAVGVLSIPVIAVVVDDDLGLFLVTALTLGPLAVLLARSGARDDGRRPSPGFGRRAPVLVAVAGAFAALAVVAAVVDNQVWLPCFWIGVFTSALARSWGFRL